MATLKEIKGTTIQFRDSDPEVYAGSWSSGGAMNTARNSGSSSSGGGADSGFINVNINLEEVNSARNRIPSLSHDRAFEF